MGVSKPFTESRSIRSDHIVRFPVFLMSHSSGDLGVIVKPTSSRFRRLLLSHQPTSASNPGTVLTNASQFSKKNCAMRSPLVTSPKLFTVGAGFSDWVGVLSLTRYRPSGSMKVSTHYASYNRFTAPDGSFFVPIRVARLPYKTLSGGKQRGRVVTASEVPGVAPSLSGAPSLLQQSKVTPHDSRCSRRPTRNWRSSRVRICRAEAKTRRKA